MLWAGKDVKAHVIPSLCHRQGTPTIPDFKIQLQENTKHTQTPALHCHDIQRIFFLQGTKRCLLKAGTQIPQPTIQKWINCFHWSQRAQSQAGKHVAGVTFPEFKGALGSLLL